MVKHSMHFRAPDIKLLFPTMIHQNNEKHNYIKVVQATLLLDSTFRNSDGMSLHQTMLEIDTTL